MRTLLIKLYSRPRRYSSTLKAKNPPQNFFIFFQPHAAQLVFTAVNSPSRYPLAGIFPHSTIEHDQPNKFLLRSSTTASPAGTNGDMAPLHQGISGSSVMLFPSTCSSSGSCSGFGSDIVLPFASSEAAFAAFSSSTAVFPSGATS